MALQRICMVVGLGGKGIGDAVTKKFVTEGYRVAMLARTKENLDRLEGELGGQSKAKGFVCDACKPDEVAATVQAVLADKDFNPDARIDVLIYNAGGTLILIFLNCY